MTEPKQPLTPQQFTAAVQPLLEALQQGSHGPIQVSDVTDDMEALQSRMAEATGTGPMAACKGRLVQQARPRQYVDLVQEGGGVHGIALAGYTYILEKMGISFVKMAGTSAGAINTMLLNAVLRKDEAERLEVSGNWYETRSEKMLEYLANKDLSDFVDGHPVWRRLLLRMFSGTAGMGVAGRKIKRYLRTFVYTLALLLALVAGSAGLLMARSAGNLHLWRWITGIAGAGLLALLAIWAFRALWLRFLWRHAGKLGINPGDNFERWMQEILAENGIATVNDLRLRLKALYDCYPLTYSICSNPATPEAAPPPGQPVSVDPGRKEQLLREAADPKIAVSHIAKELEIMFPRGDDFKQAERRLLMPAIESAFQQRVCTMIGEKKAAEQRGENRSTNYYTREMVIVSSDITNGIKVEFPGMHRMYWGDDYSISPARYVRASMSVPIFFQPFTVKFNPAQQLVIREEWDRYMHVQKEPGGEARFVDGGVLSNFPLNVFFSPDIVVPRMPTLGIKLEYEDDTMSNQTRSISELVGNIISTMRFFYDRDFIIKNNLYKKTVRSIDTGAIHWLNFNLTDQEKVELFFRGALAATIFLAGSRGITPSGIQQLIEMGRAVRFNEGVFSIYRDGEPVFRIEDCLLADITFRWPEYKRERLEAVLGGTTRQQELKDSAAGKIG